MTLGFAETGEFEVTLAVEMDPDAADTYASNFGDHVFRGRVEDVSEYPSADVVIGGPPCQGFSTLNMRGVGLERRRLWREYFRALEDASPIAFVMENVPGLLRSSEYESFRLHATRLGYRIESRMLNAADYGVPQRRSRAVVIGSRVGPIVWPDTTHASPAEDPAARGLCTWRTFREAVSGLPLVPDGDNWHRARNPTELSLERYRAIPHEGQNRFDLARERPDITPRCWLEKPRGSTDVFGRLWWDRPAYTIRTEFFKPEKGRYLHPSEHRPITVREAARCMSLPDSFVFPEYHSMTAVGRQIGNAVPPALARAIAASLAAVIGAPASDCRRASA